MTSILWENHCYQDEVQRAASIMRWLETSGPRYIEATVGFISAGSSQARVIWDGVETWFQPNEMSYASWAMCQCAKTGDALTLLLRSDPVRSVRNIQ